MRLVATEGATDKSTHSLSDSFAVPMALALGAGPTAVGILVAVPRLVAAVSQLFAPVAISKARSYRTVLLGSALLAALAFAGVAAVPWMPVSIRIPMLVLLVAAGIAFLEFPTPALGCWVSDQVPLRRRGQFMAWRYGLSAGATIAVLLLGGPFLDSMQGRAVVGLAGLFGVASALRLFAAGLFFNMSERSKPGQLARPTLVLFHDTLRKTNLGRFLIYTSVMNFGAFLANPFFAPFQLQELHFSYSGLLYPAVVMTVTTLVGVQIFGRMADRWGNLNLLRGASLALPIIPALWIFVTVPMHSALINVISGLAWAAFNLCSLNFVIELSSESDRANNIAFLFFADGVALSLGAITGAFVFPHLPTLAGSPYHSIFALSATVRLLPAVIVLPFVREVRRRQPTLRLLPTPPLAPTPDPGPEVTPELERMPTAA